MQENLDLEQNEASKLLEKGVKFKVGKREYEIKEFYAGTLDILSDLFIKMQFDEELLKDNPIAESKKITKRTAKLCARALAVAVLNDKWKIKFLTPFLTQKFLWSITPSKLLKASLIIAQMSNFGDFINSIRLIAGTRTTKPNPIERDKQA